MKSRAWVKRSVFAIAVLSTWIPAGRAQAAFRGLAPDSIGGKVFHATGAVRLGIKRWDWSVVLATNGQFTFLASVNGTSIDPTQFRSFTVPIEENGNYTYVRTGTTAATLTLVKSSGGILWALKLDFSQPIISGYVSITVPSGAVDNGNLGDVGSFWLTDIEPPQPVPMLNTALRGAVAPGKPLIAGFVIPGPQARDVLIRVVGPSLAQFGINDSWSDPDFALYQGSGVTYLGAHYGDWSSSPSPQGGPPATANFQRIFGFVGAFPLAVGSKDAVRLIRLLGPGAYTVVCSPAVSDPGGGALIEVYVLP